jgi:hypothetical protein
VPRDRSQPPEYAILTVMVEQEKPCHIRLVTDRPVDQGRSGKDQRAPGQPDRRIDPEELEARPSIRDTLFPPGITPSATRP